MADLLSEYAIALLRWETEVFPGLPFEEVDRMRSVAALSSNAMEPTVDALYGIYEREASAARVVDPSHRAADFATFASCIRRMPRAVPAARVWPKNRPDARIFSR